VLLKEEVGFAFDIAQAVPDVPLVCMALNIKVIFGNILLIGWLS
jgi:hypothetical protein